MGLNISDKAWLLQQFPKKVKLTRLLFSSKDHGWKVEDWRRICIGQKQTFTFYKSKVGNISAGYLDIEWKKDGGYNNRDPNAFLVSINHRRKLTNDGSKHVTYFGPFYGPLFG